MNSKKGQAATEYLMTYGWALLLLVAVIAVILATGVFNPSYFISEECVIQPDIACTGHQMYRPGGTAEAVLEMRIENRLGYDILLDKVEITANDLGEPGERAVEENVNEKLPQGQNDTVQFEFSGNKQPPIGTMERMKVAVTYYTCAREVNPACEKRDEYKHVAVGRITARVEQGG